MTRAASTAAALVDRASGWMVRRLLRRVTQRIEELETLGDDELVAACQRLLSAPKVSASSVPSMLLNRLRGDALNERDCEAIALAAVGFSRFPPAGLPRGSRLYEEQLLAAIHLQRGTIVQMDTGEGKTFALSTAALALLRIHPRVYVVTANPYLAARDASQTRPFWQALGISVGLALPQEYTGSDRDPWTCQVVYTTLSTLGFRSLDEELGGDEPTMAWSALLLDEVDAILLEQSTQPLHTIRFTDPTAKDWSAPIQLAQALEESDIRRNLGLGVWATLTPAGEAHVLALAEGAQALAPSDRLMLLHDVELAYAALRLARPGHDYDVLGSRVVTIDPASGWHTHGVTHDWVLPLEQHLGLPGNPRRVVRHMIDGISLIRRFAHVAGASGTVVEEALDYLLLLSLLPAVVPARTPRFDGVMPDKMVGSRERAHRWVVDQVQEHGQHRPILVVTDSMQEAIGLAEQIASAQIEGVTVRAVTGETIAEERVFETAGQPGTTIVSTRVAGRGVDISLTDEARAAGGAMLLAIGHSPEGRLDRQLLGRVGRNGDPFSACFISHPDDPLWQQVGQNAMTRMTQATIGDDVIESRFFGRSLAGAQRRLRRQRLQRFAGRIAEGTALGDAYALLRRWRESLGEREDDVPDAFVAFLVDGYLATRFPGLLFRDEESFAEPAPAASEISRIVGRPEDAGRLVVQTLGQPATVVRETFSRYLTEAIDEAREANAVVRAELAERLAVAERALGEVRALHCMRELTTIADGAEDDDALAADALRVALDASKAVPGRVAVSAETCRELSADLDAWTEPPSEAGAPEGPVEPAAARTALVALVAEVADQIAAGEGPADALWPRIERAAEERRPIAEASDPRWEHHASRSSWAIACETIDRATQRLDSGLERVRFQVSQTIASPRYTATYRTRVRELLREVEATLAGELCANLAGAGEPAALDELFVDAEHQLDIREPRLALTLPDVPLVAAPLVSPPAAAPLSTESEELMLEYVAGLRERLGEDAVEERLLYPAFNALLQVGLSSLTDADRVASAWAAYRKSRVRDRMSPWRRRTVDRHVKGFLVFLYDRGLAAPLPTGLAGRARSRVRRLRATLATPGLMLAGGVLAMAAVLAGLLAIFPDPRGPLDLSVGLSFGDRLLTAGALGAGLALGPALLAIVGGMYVRFGIGLPVTVDAGAHQFERIASLVLLVCGAALVTRPWSAGGAGSALAAIAVALAIAFLGLALRNNAWLFEQLTHTRLSAGLAAAFAGLAGLPLLAQLGGTERVLPIVAVVAGLLTTTLRLRRASIPVVAIRVDSDSPQGIDTLALPRWVQAPLSIVPHAFALLLAWVLSCVLLDVEPAARSIVAGAAYFAVLVLWERSLAGSVTELELWSRQMREREQAYEPTQAAPQLIDALRAARRRVTALELSVAFVMVGFATAMTLSAPAAAVEHLPLGMAAICATVVALDLGREFVRSLSFSTVGLAATAIDPALDDAEGLLASAGEVVRHIGRRMSVAIVVLVVLSHVADAIGVWTLIVSIADAIGGLVS